MVGQVQAVRVGELDDMEARLESPVDIFQRDEEARPCRARGAGVGAQRRSGRARMLTRAHAAPAPRQVFIAQLHRRARLLNHVRVPSLSCAVAAACAAWSVGPLQRPPRLATRCASAGLGFLSRASGIGETLTGARCTRRRGRQEFQARVLNVIRAHAVDYGGGTSPVATAAAAWSEGLQGGEGGRKAFGRGGVGYFFRHRQRGSTTGVAMFECRFDGDEVWARR